MSEKTKIAWCDSTLNFWSGCTKVSPGCTNCYAEALSKNKFFGGGKTIGQWGKGAPRQLHESAFSLALRLNKKPWICPVCGHAMTEEESKGYKGCPVETFNRPNLVGKRQFDIAMHAAQHHRRRIFSLSLGDWLDDEVPIEWLARMLDTIRQCDQVTWILCTKRPENWIPRMFQVQRYFRKELGVFVENDNTTRMENWNKGNAPKNIILLTSVENQEQADKRIPELLKIPAACHGLSLEPLLGPVDLSKWIWKDACGCDENEPEAGDGFQCKHCKDTHAVTELDWLIVGGESGPKARPCNVEWIRLLVQQGKAAGVAKFVKQLGTRPEINHGTVSGYQTSNHTLKLRDKKGGDPSEWPEDLRIREFPKGF